MTTQVDRDGVGNALGRLSRKLEVRGLAPGKITLRIEHEDLRRLTAILKAEDWNIAWPDRSKPPFIGQPTHLFGFRLEVKTDDQ